MGTKGGACAPRVSATVCLVVSGARAEVRCGGLPLACCPGPTAGHGVRVALSCDSAVGLFWGLQGPEWDPLCREELGSRG